jgi:hypothetical protein
MGLGDRECCPACDVAERDLIAGGRGGVAQVELEVDLALELAARPTVLDRLGDVSSVQVRVVAEASSRTR